MRHSNLKIIRRWVVVLMMIALMGCAAKPARIELPINHPANPQAPEAAFSLPPNPFQRDIAIQESEAKTDSPMIHKKHESSKKRPMGHQMEAGKHAQPVPESETQQGHEKSGQQQKEHNK